MDNKIYQHVLEEEERKKAEEEKRKEAERQKRKERDLINKFCREEFGGTAKEVKAFILQHGGSQQGPPSTEAALEIQKLRAEIETLKAVDATDMILETMQPVFDEVDRLAKEYGCTVQELLNYVGSDRQISYYRSYVRP